jgi:low temperature requirement protein LtrA
VLLIALGESILAVGATFGALTWSAPVVAAFIVGFVGTVSLYWIYFVGRAGLADEVIARAADPTRIGRTGYAYAHGIMVGGVIVVAVGIELTISHATGATSAAAAWVILAGPALYLAGNSLFKVTLSRRAPVSRLVAIAVLALLAPLALVVDPLALSTAAAVVTVTLAVSLGRARSPTRS